MKNERRAGAPAKIEPRDEGIRVSGHAAIFNEEARIGNFFREVILPGAFEEALSRSDVIFNVNHEGLPLARSTSGTLSLSVDSRGLLMSTDLDPSDPDVQAIVPKLKRGDLSKMSFAFTVAAEEWEEPDDDIPLRKITKFDRLFDVSIVNTPAYAGTDIGLRGLEALRAASRAGHAARLARMDMTLALAGLGQESGRR